MDEYVNGFVARMEHVTGLTDDHFRSIFLRGLQPDIKLWISRKEAPDLFTAMQSARFLRATVYPSHRDRLHPRPRIPPQTAGDHGSPLLRPPILALGLSRARPHVESLMGFVIYLTRNISIALNEVSATVAMNYIPVMIVGGFDGPKTMKLWGLLNGARVRVMIDSGASQCFVSDQLVDRLYLPVNSSSRPMICLGDGKRRSALGLCAALGLTFGDADFEVACYSFPLGGIYVILGVSWLATLGDVQTNWARMTMKFKHCDKLVELCGKASLARREISMASLQKLSNIETCWVLFAIHVRDEGKKEDRCNYAPTNMQDDPNFVKIITEFKDVFQSPSTLPPLKHQITISHLFQRQLPYQFVHIVMDRVVTKLRANEMSGGDYALVNDILFFKGRVVVAPSSSWTTKLMEEFHSTPLGGHSGTYKTYCRLAANVYWPDMVRQVLLKLNPHRRATLQGRLNVKLAAHFFGQFVVSGRVGAVAYRLQLPPSYRVHPVFHVSQLKPLKGNYTAKADLPDALLAKEPLFVPQTVLEKRVLKRGSDSVKQVLVKWVDRDDDETTVDEVDMRGQFSDFSLEHKAVSNGEGVDRERRLIVYTRRSREVAH
ncbi:hypothetical protein C2S51_037244 [Perilla frutescens var. frutescens]|nr:hypothetical protein C2S51_037244 [Perilla frutescens var. frutescens]